MDVKLRKIVMMLLVTVFLVGCTSVNLKIVSSSSTNGNIDLFTQKDPYSGKGSNMPSDVFGLGEVVVLYALTTDDGNPLQNLLVTFHVQSANGSSFYLTTETNASGIATTTFSIPEKQANVTEVFGEWFVLASVLIKTDYFQDTLTFKVNWIVKLVSVRTIDENRTYRTSFGVGGDVGLEITLRSMAMSIRSTTLAIVIHDELDTPINQLEVNGLKVQPNEKMVLLYCRLYIPKWAYIGKSTVFVSALTTSANQSLVAYCPAISTDFFIGPYEPLTIRFHDVAVVDVVPSATVIELGQPLLISVVVGNEGTEVDSFNVNAYCDDVSIGASEVIMLSPYCTMTLNFILNTSLFDLGSYTITVSIPQLADEVDLTDNTLVDGTIEIKSKTPSIIHNVAIVDVDVSKESIYIGESMQVNVSITNKGSETETFDVSVYYDSSLIETLKVNTLAPNASRTMIFIWNTSSVSEGSYQIIAYAEPVHDEIDISDNTYINGIVEVKAKPSTLHDIAVLNVSLSSNTIYVGEILDISITVKNEGSFTESFNVVVHYDSYIAGAIFVKSLMPNCIKTLDFHWNTAGVTGGNYTITAEASAVLGELNIDNNEFIDGVVWIKLQILPEVVETPRWALALLFLLTMFILACLSTCILIILLWRRKRKKEDQMGRQPASPRVNSNIVVGLKRSKTCKVCGKEFSEAYTFCPYCFTFHG